MVTSLLLFLSEEVGVQRGELISKKAGSDGAEAKTRLLMSVSALLHCASPL